MAVRTVETGKNSRRRPARVIVVDHSSRKIGPARRTRAAVHSRTADPEAGSIEPELHLGEDIVVPDLADWRRERLPNVPDAPFITVAPDWLCEALSPSTARLDRTPKRRIYARENVSWLWFMDALARRVEAFELVNGHYLVIETWVDDAKPRIPPFDAVEIDLAAVWQDIEPSTQHSAP